MMTVEIAAMRSEFQRGYQSIVTSHEEGLQRSGDLCLRRKCGVQAFCRRQNLGAGGIHFRPRCSNQGSRWAAAQWDIAAMRSEFQRGYQSIVTSLVERKVCAAHGANDLEIFCRDMCVAKNTSHAASVEGRSPR